MKNKEKQSLKEYLLGVREFFLQLKNKNNEIQYFPNLLEGRLPGVTDIADNKRIFGISDIKDSRGR